MLVPCNACARHVRMTEPTCPFCGVALELVSPRELPPMPSDRLLARAALSFAAAAAIGSAACGKSNVDPEPANPQPTDASIPKADAGPDPNSKPAYGLPPVRDK